MPGPEERRTLDSLLAHANLARGLARGLVGDEHLAEDVVQDAWVAALERPPERGPVAWLRTVVRNLGLNLRRGRARRARREESAAPRPAPPSPEDLAAQRETLRRVTEAVLALEEPYRSTVLARFYEDLAPEAIARRDGVPAATVRSRLHRALALLRERLDGGDRRWRLALLPLVPRETLPAVPAAATGGIVMATSTKVAVGAAVVLTAVLLWLSVGPGADTPGEQGRGAESAAGARGSSRAARATEPGASRDSPERPGTGEGAPSPKVAATGGTGGGEPDGKGAEAGAGAATTGEPPAPSKAAAGDEPMTMESAPEEIGGLVLDAETGKPVEGARILLGVKEAWYGDTTGSTGRFGYRPKELLAQGGKLLLDAEARREPLALTIKARGFKEWKGAPAREPMEIRLERDREARRPGVIAGTLTREDGHPATGAWVFALNDRALETWTYQWAWCDDAGGFALQGVGPGRIGIMLSKGTGKPTEVTVPEDGTVRVDLKAGPVRDTRSEEFPEDLREVLVADLPADAAAGGAVRAQARFGSFFRVAVEGTSARFDRLPLGSWKFVLQRPGQPDAVMNEVVGRGEGAMTIRFAPR